jgi:nicotinamidase-related amidase
MSRALLVIDVQNEYFSGALPITHPAGHLDRILRVMDAATGRVPVAVIQHSFAQLFRARRHWRLEELSEEPMSVVTMYDVVRGYLSRLRGRCARKR